jgi:hypothetical protein
VVPQITDMNYTLVDNSKFKAFDPGGLLKGEIRLGNDLFYRFWPAIGIELTCRECRDIAEKLSALNEYSKLG